jgi:hypothetical protein
MFMLNFPYEKEYYKKWNYEVFNDYDFSKNWELSTHLWMSYSSHKDEIISKNHFDAFKMYMNMMKEVYKY